MEVETTTRSDSVRTRGRAWPAVVAVSLTVALVLAAPTAASTGERGSTAEVGPGIHLAPASAFADPERTAGDVLGPGPLEPELTRRVVGGSPTTIRRWPWQVSIGYLPISPTNAFRNHHCGGTLVSPSVVVTAAHCMTLGPNRNFRPAEEFQVTSGRRTLSTSAGQEHEIADYFWFVDGEGEPLWNPDTIEWDVVFLVLASPANRRTIKIAGSDEAGIWAPGRRAFVTGWGSTIAGTGHEVAEKLNKSDVLRQARIRMLSDSGCEAVYGAEYVATVMVCAGDLAGGVDVCSGDSGGPLVVPIAGGGYRLIGDVSFGDGCGVPGIPGVYGRLATDPIRGALREGVEAVAGVDVVGSGAEPSNRFAFGRLRQARDGAPRLAVRVPGRGQVKLR
ncbi:MAG TPA: serine protease, partial [Solirubrobacterales bacterium]|nr:serine protease [Solirubrobacterales bacterium]